MYKARLYGSEVVWRRGRKVGVRHDNRRGKKRRLGGRNMHGGHLYGLGHLGLASGYFLGGG